MKRIFYILPLAAILIAGCSREPLADGTEDAVLGDPGPVEGDDHQEVRALWTFLHSLPPTPTPN